MFFPTWRRFLINNELLIFVRKNKFESQLFGKLFYLFLMAERSISSNNFLIFTIFCFLIFFSGSIGEKFERSRRQFEKFIRVYRTVALAIGPSSGWVSIWDMQIARKRGRCFGSFLATNKKWYLLSLNELCCCSAAETLNMYWQLYRNVWCEMLYERKR